MNNPDGIRQLFDTFRFTHRLYHQKHASRTYTCSTQNAGVA